MKKHVCVSITEEQYDFMRRNGYNISKILQEAIDAIRPIVEKKPNYGEL